MSSRLKRRKKEPPDKSSPKIADTIGYKESFGDPSWMNERSLADKIMNFIRSKGLDFRLDELTRGRGNCFMIAILQQMNRGEVAEVACPGHAQMAISMNHQELRKKVQENTQHSKHWKIMVELQLSTTQ